MPMLPDVAVPKDLPAEFEQYLRGAICYYRQDNDAARKAWQSVLDLPAQRSQYRAIWAAYMIARSYFDTDPQTAVKCFPKVRDLAKAGFHDSMGLVAASYGWQAILGVQGPTWMTPNFCQDWQDQTKRDALLAIARAVESQPALDPHMVAIARRPHVEVTEKKGAAR